mmetsp:Transcript_12226/g.15864  ORF Transcript_12226/g.15864 Transcript_12226/m.15864 type:complete len:644 (-) Transcript_12226:584-2515(-)
MSSITKGNLRNLVERAVEFVKNFNPVKQTIDAYVFDKLGDTNVEGASPDNIFLFQVLYGCVRHKEALKVFLLHFFHDKAAAVLRSDYSLYLVLAYLSLFRIHELGFEVLRGMMESLEPNKMEALISYLIEPGRLSGELQQEWNKLYDIDYVSNTMIAGVEEHKDLFQDLATKLQHKAFGIARAKEEAEAQRGMTEKSCKPLTVPVAPNITRPRPRKVPEPMRIDQQVKVGPDPVYIENTKSLDQVHKDKEERLERIREQTMKQYDASQHFKLHETRSNIHKVRKEVEEERQKELQFDMKHANPIPRYPEKGAAVKMNVAQVLREDALFKKKQQNEAALIKAYEAELRDSTEFYRWQTDMRERDLKIKAEQVEAKRMFAKQSAIDAKLAMEQQRQDNYELATAIRSEGQAMKEQRELEEEVGLMVREQLVREMAEVRDTAPQAAKDRVLKERQENKRRMAEEAEARAAWKAEQDAREQAEREDLIRQLKAMRVHQKNVKVFDPTESVGMGLLEEMSLVELRERLEINKVRQMEIEQEKRSEIAREKLEKQKDLQDRLGNIKRLRDSAAKANKTAKGRRKAAEEERRRKAEAMREEGNMALLGQLQTKHRQKKEELSALREEDERRKKRANVRRASKRGAGGEAL